MWPIFVYMHIFPIFRENTSYMYIGITYYQLTKNKYERKYYIRSVGA